MKTRLLIPFLAIMLFTFNSYGQDGASIFKKNCGVCHTIGHGKIVGPDLKGADKKHDIKWMTEWIKSSQSMINIKKDPTAIQLFNDNNKMVMTDQPLTNDEIKTVVAFIGDETAKLQTTTATTAAPVATQVTAQSTSDSSTGVSSRTLNYILIGIIAFLTIIIIGLSMIIKSISKNVKK